MDTDTTPVETGAPVETITAESNTPVSGLSPSEAARQLANFRWKRDNPTESNPTEATGEDAGEAPQDTAEEVDEAAPPVEAPGDTAEGDQGTVDPEDEAPPPIEPPRSWAQSHKEEFAKLPREVQEIVTQRETERDTATRRAQNEAAEIRKVADEARQAAEQVRAQYEEALPVLLQTLQDQAAGEFPDIKSMQDVERLAREDWPRYALWDAHQKKVAAITEEMRHASEVRQQEAQQQWVSYVTEQDKALLEKMPELADQNVAIKFAKGAADVLRDVGFADQDLQQLWNGQAALSLRDHRVQMLLLDGVRYREAKQKVAKPAPKPVPPVQRPGTSGRRVSAADAEIQSLEQRFQETGSVRDAAALRAARNARAATRKG